MPFRLLALVIWICGAHPYINAEVYRIANDEYEELIPISTEGGSTPDGLIMTAGIYGFNGPYYDCTQEGIYRFYTVPNVSTQRLVFTNNIDCLMNSVSWLVCHGFQDDGLDYATALDVAKMRKLHMTCGGIANFTISLLSNLGVTSRFVLFLTLDPWNSYNNGHSITEVFQNGRWELWDVDFRNRFERNGKRLNAWEFKQAVAANDYEIITFSRSPSLELADLTLDDYNYSFFYEAGRLFEERTRRQYRRCVQVILIRKDHLFYFTCHPSDRERVESYNPAFIYMDEKDFLEMFYS